MKLNEDEKLAVNMIQEGTIKSAANYVLTCIPHKTLVNNTANFGVSFGSISAGVAVPVFTDRYVARGMLMSFLALCRRLEVAGLIRQIPKQPTQADRIAVFHVPDGLNPPEKHLLLDTEFLAVYENNYQFAIAPLPDLEDFIRNNYMTSFELGLAEEKKSRQKVERLTLTVAVVSVATSIITAVGVTWFNYKTYTTDRVVTISNAAAFNEPVEVTLKNPLNLCEPEAAAPNNSLQARRP